MSETSERGRLLCAMSGGVDSAVAAGLLARAGSDVVGVTFRIGSGSEAEGTGCCSARQACDAAECAAALGIRHFVHHAEAEFQEAVVRRFAEAYAGGLTPNPCIDCNRFVRFPTLLRLARELGAERIATGHYACVESDPVTGRRCIARAADGAKDQSYVLYPLEQETLARLELPLAGLRKAETRALARDWGLPVATKPDSQDICFVASGDYRSYLVESGAVGVEPGPIVGADGAVLGHHEGTYRYTVGQRRGIGIPGAQPLYVISSDPHTRTVVVGGREDLLIRAVRAEHVVFGGAGPEGFASAAPVRAQLRSHGAPLPARASWQDGELTVLFDEPVGATAPGQSVVCYDAESERRVLCGGVITACERAHSSSAATSARPSGS